MATDTQYNWAIAPAHGGYGWNWAASDKPMDQIDINYLRWHIRWGTKWGWSPFRFIAAFEGKRHAKRLHRIHEHVTDIAAHRAGGSIGGPEVVSDAELERQFNRIKKELERRKDLK